MVKKTDSRNFWSASKERSPFNSDASRFSQHPGTASAACPPEDWTRLNTIEMAVLLDDPGSRDDFKNQIRRFLANKLENHIEQDRPRLG